MIYFVYNLTLAIISPFHLIFLEPTKLIIDLFQADRNMAVFFAQNK